jgi:hypothetical protein
MVEIMWAFAFISVQGLPAEGVMKENNKFDTLEKCADFGAEYAPRVADYVRGMAKLDWDDPVHVRHACLDKRTPV